MEGDTMHSKVLSEHLSGTNKEDEKEDLLY
jgi:hypothetical protein